MIGWECTMTLLGMSLAFQCLAYTILQEIMIKYRRGGQRRLSTYRNHKIHKAVSLAIRNGFPLWGSSAAASVGTSSDARGAVQTTTHMLLACCSSPIALFFFPFQAVRLL